MTEEQIERQVEKMVDRLDAIFMRSDSTMTQEEYDREMRAIDEWARTEYARCSPLRHTPINGEINPFSSL